MKLRTLIYISILFSLAMLLYTIYTPFVGKSLWEQIITGTVGLLFMFSMHIYSLRKRYYQWFFFRKIKLSLAKFLDIHIVLGTLGFILILFHSEFSFNNFVAWFATSILLIIWLSGFLGKFIYGNIPRSLNGKEKEKDELMLILEKNKKEFVQYFPNTDQEKANSFLDDLLKHFENNISLAKEQEKNQHSLFVRVYHLIKMYLFIPKYQKKINNILTIERSNNSDRNVIVHKFTKLLKLDFQIVFLKSLKQTLKHWHNFHVPLTIIFFTMVVFHFAVILLFNYSKLFQ